MWWLCVCVCVYMCKCVCNKQCVCVCVCVYSNIYICHVSHLLNSYNCHYYMTLPLNYFVPTTLLAIVYYEDRLVCLLQPPFWPAHVAVPNLVSATDYCSGPSLPVPVLTMYHSPFLHLHYLTLLHFHYFILHLLLYFTFYWHAFIPHCCVIHILFIHGVIILLVFHAAFVYCSSPTVTALWRCDACVCIYLFIHLPNYTTSYWTLLTFYTRRTTPHASVWR